MAAFQAMQVSPVKHSDMRLPDRQAHEQTDRQTNVKQSHPYVPLSGYAKQATQHQNSKECMYRLQNTAMHDYQESVTTGQTVRHMDKRQTK